MPRILVFDRDIGHATALATALQRRNHSITVRRTQEEFLAEEENGRPRFDIVILDLSQGRPEDWKILDRSEEVETSNKNYAAYIREAFGNAYRLSDANWEKLRSGSFYSPWHRRAEIEAAKVMIFHAMDDPHVPYEGSVRFAKETGVALKSLRRGGHLRTEFVVRKYWEGIKKFLDSD